MRIVTVRRISQVFFLALFFWLCVVSSFGVQWWELRGWPVSWFLHLDPLVALGTLLTTQTIYRDLLWAVFTVVLTILLGRFFCSWVCPFGTMHHFVGYLGKRGKGISGKIAGNRYHKAQSIKYLILVVLLSAAGGTLLARFMTQAVDGLPRFLILSIVVGAALVIWVKWRGGRRKVVAWAFALVAFWVSVGSLVALDRAIVASLQTGLLDPIPLVYRSVNMTLLPLLDSTSQALWANPRHYEGAWLIGAVFLGALLLNLRTPRFYCRYICPLGALYGILGKYALFRVGKNSDGCPQCGLCEADCEGACEPTGTMRINECVLCMNCLNDCRHGVITYSTGSSTSGEIASPDLSRRGLVISMASGIVAVPLMRLGGTLGDNWNPEVMRPPGSLAEADFLSRCIKCGQCMRVCPTNIIHPAGLENGTEGLWTPILNFRLGTSGCQLNCVACGHVCPTAAIRPISLDEKRGLNQFAEFGPIRMGMAFVDHGRCLPWAMDKPCIVCQENCPMSPKAIFVREVFITVRGGVFKMAEGASTSIHLTEAPMKSGQYGTGDYYVRVFGSDTRHRILGNTDRVISLSPDHSLDVVPPPGAPVEIQVRLQRPQVDPEKCIGCGVCEHECPVTGRRAIRVTAENESRSRKRSMIL